MKKILILPSFERSVARLTLQEKSRLFKSLEEFNNYLLTHRATFCFRLKKISYDKYEFRVDLKLRVIVKKEADIFYLVLVGTHEDIRKYLRNYR